MSVGPDVSAGARRGAALILRRPTGDDADDIAALHGDARVMRYIDDGRPVPALVARSRDMGWLTADHGPHLGYRVAVDRTGRFLGWFGIRPVLDHPGVGELGYRLRPDVWGMGVATEGARTMIDLAFATRSVERIVATTMVVNVASRRVMEKAGLHWERTVVAEWPDPIPGWEQGDVHHGLSIDEWGRGRGSGIRP